VEIEFEIIAYKSKAWEEAVEFREEILRKPLGQRFTPEELNEEKNHCQIIGLVENKVVAAAVLVPEKAAMKMQRVVVSEKYRNLAVGSTMMRFCEAYALKKGYDMIYCHARESAVNFYLKNDYTPEGDYFDEDGIPHLKMKKNMAAHMP
jgi:predicted GNAT family N-acyltransferase